MATIAKRPRRAVDRDSRFFADGLAAGVILIQRCSNCGTLRHPPAPICAKCRSFEWDTIEASGRGSIYTFAVHHAPQIPAFPSPHTILLVELAEGVRMIGDFIGEPAGPIAIGAPVRAVIAAEEDDDDMLLVRWRLEEPAA